MRIGSVQKKVLLLMFGGLTIGLSGNPKQAFKVIKIIGWEWKKINRQNRKSQANFSRSLKKLYDSKLISTKNNFDGTITLTLTEKGKKIAIRYDTEKIKPKKLKNWDRKWRVIIFDIPENRRAKRDSFRKRLKEMNFLELQKSVWVSPIDYRKEIEYLIRAFDAKLYAKFMVVDYMENDKELRKRFKISCKK